MADALAPERESGLLDLLDQTTEMICTSDPSGQITYANQSWQRTLGYTLAEAMEVRPVDLVAPEQRGMYLELARRLNRGEAIAWMKQVRCKYSLIALPATTFKYFNHIKIIVF